MKLSKLSPYPSKLPPYLVLALALFASTGVLAQQTLITGVNIFDGKSDKLLVDHNVLIEGNLITQLGKNLQADTATNVIDGGGRTLMPGMIDIHSHLCVQNGLSEGRDNWDQMAMGAITGAPMRTLLSWMATHWKIYLCLSGIKSCWL